MPIKPDDQARLTGWLATGQARTWREQLGLSQEQAAIEIGVRTATYARWERHQTSPRRPNDQAAYQVINRWRRRTQSSASLPPHGEEVASSAE